MNRQQRRQNEKRALQNGPISTSVDSPISNETIGSTSIPAIGLRPIDRRLHVLGVPHTVPHDDYAVCAFTIKIKNFPDIIQPFGWTVIEYANEGSQSGASEHVVVLTKAELAALSRRKSREEPHDVDVQNVPLKEAFQKSLIEKICARALPGDIVCHVFGPNMDVYNRLPNCRHVESSVGYTASPGLPFRIYESSAWMHWHHGKAGRENGSHYQWVIPSGFDPSEWSFCETPGDYALYLGRITRRKGMNELVEIARRLPDVPIRAYGPGDSSEWARNAPPNLTFHGPVFGDERIKVVRQARCMLMPTLFIEPFGNSGVEAQFCGVPLIASSFGAFQETVWDGVTGFRCHTLADWVEAVRLSQTLDRRRIADIARSKYSRDIVGKQYNWALRQLADLSDKGWYSEASNKFSQTPVDSPVNEKPSRHIWIYMPYFGKVPNYFQLYLDSLEVNAAIMSVVFVTDIDLSRYRIPNNLIVIPVAFDQIRKKIKEFIGENFNSGQILEDILPNHYKLCDFKILYPEMFLDIGAALGVTEDDFVGWGDCDLIYGRFSDFIDRSNDFHLIGGYHGHLTAIRNIPAMRQLFKDIPDLVEHLKHPKNRLVDEKEFRAPLFNHIKSNKYNVFNAHNYLCDVVPSIFYNLFRNDYASRQKNFFDAYNPKKEINHASYDRDGRLSIVYDDGSVRQSLYCHLQKRKMSLEVEGAADGFYIYENSFEPVMRAIATPADLSRSYNILP